MCYFLVLAGMDYAAFKGDKTRQALIALANRRASWRGFPGKLTRVEIEFRERYPGARQRQRWLPAFQYMTIVIGNCPAHHGQRFKTIGERRQTEQD